MGGAFGNTPLRVGRIEDFIVPLTARALPRLAVGSGFMLAVQANGAVLSWGRGDSGGAVRALATQPLAGSAAAWLPSLGAVTVVASNGWQYAEPHRRDIGRDRRQRPRAVLR
jgi:hypothetical protein